jgi:hypothetical protein
LVVGSSGAGKSSLSTALIDKGARMLTDDLIAIEKTEEGLCALPSFYEQKVSSELIEHYGLGKKVTGQHYYPWKKKDKYYVDRSDIFVSEKKKIDKIVFIRKSYEELQVEEISGVAKIDILLHNVFRNRFIVMSKSTKAKFETINELAKQIDLYRISRPKHKNTVEEQVSKIFEYLEV